MQADCKNILFSRKDDWEAGMRSAIGAHLPHFHDFDSVDAERFDLVVPLTLEDARHFNLHFAHLNRVTALVPSTPALEACDDKQEFARRVARAGFTRFLPRCESLAYPYLLKKRISEWGMDTYIIDGEEEEDLHAGKLGSAEYIRQEHIAGQQEYTTHLLVAGGRSRFIRTVAFNFAETLFVKGRHFTPVSQECVDHACYRTLFEDILGCVGLEGICCFNYKLDAGTPKIFEVNPRYGASLTPFLAEVIDCLDGLLGETRDRRPRRGPPMQAAYSRE